MCRTKFGVFAGVLASVAGIGSSAWAQAFTPGDVYLVSAALPGPAGQNGAGIARIQPGSWTVTRHYTGPAGMAGRATYDAARQRIVIGGFGAPASLVFVDAEGVVTNVNVPRLDVPAASDTCRNPAATGDGRVYFARAGTDSLAVLDEEGVVHEVLNEAGTGRETVVNSLQAMAYERTTGALVLAIGQGASISYERILFQPGGQQVASRTVVGQTMLPSFDVVVGLSQGPPGSVFVKSDDNSNSTLRRMQLFAVTTMTHQTFALSGYFGVGGEVAGVYLPNFGAAVVLDSLSDQLRVFVPGSPPVGTIVATSGVSSAGGSGELAQFVLITPGVPLCDPDVNADGNVDQGDIDYLVDVVGGGPNPSGADPDFNRDGNVDQGDVDALIDVVAGGDCP